MDYRNRIRAEFKGRQAPDDDVIEELAQHASAVYQAARAEGCTREEADRRLQDQLSAWTRDASVLRRRPRRDPAPAPPPSGDSRLAGVVQDLRYAARLLRKGRAHSLLVTATMALGIASATVLFSVTYGVLWKPLPWPAADRLVRVYETREGATRPPLYFTNATYLAWREKPATIDDIGAWSLSRRVVEAGGEPERMAVAASTPSLLDVLRAAPELGSGFTHRGGVPADEHEVLISHGFWIERFGGRRDAIGRSLRIDGEAYRVIGVMPAHFAFPARETRLWTPFRIRPVVEPGSGMRTLSMFGAVVRLKPGVSVAQAAAEGTARGRTGPDPGPVAMAVFGSNGPVDVVAVPLLESIAGDVGVALPVFLAAVGLLVLTATANVASLQIARSLTRRREIAVRSAIGAAGGRLMRQVLTESLLLGAAGGGAGLALAAWLHRLLPVLLPADFPRLPEIALDWQVALFAAALAIVTSVGFGLLPALQAGRVDLVAVLNEDALAPVGASVRTPIARARLAIMAGQIGVACVLLVGAALLTRSFVAMTSARRGYDPANVLTARLVLPDTRFTPQARTQALGALLERLHALPGITRAAFTTSLPLSGGEMLSSFPMRSPRSGEEMQLQVSLRHVSPDYFAAMGTRVRKGRGFTGADHESSHPVAIVNEAFVRRYLDDTPLDERIPTGFRDTVADATVVGVIEDVRQRAMTDPPQPELYRPSLQLAGGMTHDLPMLVLRTAGDPTRAVPELRRLVRESAPGAMLENVVTMEDRVRENLARPRLYAALLAGFATFAVVIAGVGLFGVLAYGVAQRAREIGVRSALGASPRAIVGLVVRQAMWITAAGLTAGLAVAALGARALNAFLYSIEPHDAVSFGGVAALLVVVSALASIAPARRAATVDPLKVLR